MRVIEGISCKAHNCWNVCAGVTRSEWDISAMLFRRHRFGDGL